MSAPRARLITRWARQAGRAPLAFLSENARLDARGLPELLTDIARSAADIPFHDDAGEVDGNWRRILLADPSFVLALLVTAEIESHAEPVDRVLEEARRGGSPRENEVLLTRLVEACLCFADDLDAWLAPADLGGVLRGQSIRRLAEEVIERVLGPQLQRLVDHVAAIEEVELSQRFRHERWDVAMRPWRRAMLEGEARGVAEAVERAWADRMLSELADAVEGFVEEMRALGRRAADAFEASLRTGDHSAHPALTIAFARIFGHVRELLNRIPEQWIDYYQHVLLHAVPAEARPDRLLLALVPKPGGRPALPQGTLVPAGKDKGGKPIVFATDTTLAVTGSMLREARLWLPDATIVRFEAGPDGSLGEPGFGIAASVPGDAFAAHAMFATPLLALRGGTRRITLELDLDGKDAATGGRIEVSVSTATGWLAVPFADAAFDAGTLRVDFVLPSDLPELAACLDGADAPPSPALRLTLHGGRMDARIRDARLSLAVKDVPDIHVRTPSGPASVTAAAPFGTPPVPGGWLRIDHPALAGPPLDRLVLRLDWAGLPPGDGGFASYYQGYVVDARGALFDWPPFDNSTFTATLTAPVPGWDASHRLPLFAPASLGSAPPVAAASPPDIFGTDFEPAPALTPERGPLAPGSWFAAAAMPDVGSKLPDHICVTLGGPIYGFGHSLHAANVQYATEAIARGEAPLPRPGFFRRLLRAILGFPARILRNVEGLERVEADAPPPAIVLLPNPPFQPLLSRIALDYARTIEAQDLTFHHAETFETATALPLRGAMLFPAPPQGLTLDLCFDGVRARDVLALLVQLAGTGVGHRPSWSYRAATGWQPLPPDALLADETHGFAATGVLRIDVPEDMARPFSLRLRFGAADAPPAIVAILPDAVSATRLVDGSETAMAPIPAGTVARLPGLAGVIQPVDSAGGRPPEAPAMLRARTAERTRHRARAASAWDVERLVLSEFPDIAQVRVLGEGDPARETMASEITVIVIPALGAGAWPRPTAAPQLRAAIADRIAGLASPFARIAVVDPVYVGVDVTACLVLDRFDLEPIQTALIALLTPGAEPSMDLDDAADADHVRAAIARFLRAQPEVRSIQRVDVTLAGPDTGWRVPIAGEIALTSVAASATASW
ncbi:hypothetical protein E5A73_08360 [Sphingomonas gei]|uniref:Baseplate protein J-like domain-containing protein n=1 Tax=Sphingomonas gei TaxID=1395960 RepID=A0A4S1XCF8_9SPHN|nr:hypothetical protein [Sphingomonas gei]TGX54124.1 hypothetical protein E5A73_08360 [Sphingomonas gei]